MVVNASGHYLIFDCETKTGTSVSEVSSQSQNQFKKQPKSHISETPKRYQKLRRKYMTRITSSKDIMIQVREICYQTKKLVLIRNKLNFELRS